MSLITFLGRLLYRGYERYLGQGYTFRVNQNHKSPKPLIDTTPHIYTQDQDLGLLFYFTKNPSNPHSYKDTIALDFIYHRFQFSYFQSHHTPSSQPLGKPHKSQKWAPYMVILVISTLLLTPPKPQLYTHTIAKEYLVLKYPTLSKSKTLTHSPFFTSCSFVVYQ